MSWTAPRTWVTGEVVTAALMNTHIRDNTRYLKGLDGAVAIGDDLTVDNLITSGNVDGVDVSTHKGGTAKAQHTGGAGSHTHQSAGAEGAKIDHGAALDGLGDDDHIIYALRTILTARGDIIFRNATVWARLAKGAEGTYLKMGANDPEWGAVTETREFMVHGHPENGATEVNEGDFLTILLDAANERWRAAFKVPHDYTSITKAVIVYINKAGGGAGTVDWTLTTDAAATGEAFAIHSDSATANGLSTEGAAVISEIDVSAAFSDIAADDYVGLWFELDAVADTGSIEIIGFLFKYS